MVRRRLDGSVITAACETVENTSGTAKRENLNGRISITQSSAKTGQPITDTAFTFPFLFIFLEESSCHGPVRDGSIHPPMRS